MNAITRQELAELDAPLVSFSLNGREVSGRATESLREPYCAAFWREQSGPTR